MKHITLSCLMAGLLCSCSTLSQRPRPEASPHAEAIQLVMSTQQAEIRGVDENDWWHDVKTREWEAKRPFHPGTIDSTHMFTVIYKIDGKIVLSWSVDTKKKSVYPNRTRDSQE